MVSFTSVLAAATVVASATTVPPGTTWDAVRLLQYCGMGGCSPPQFYITAQTNYLPDAPGFDVQCRGGGTQSEAKDWMACTSQIPYVPDLGVYYKVDYNAATIWVLHNYTIYNDTKHYSSTGRLSTPGYPYTPEKCLKPVVVSHDVTE